MMIRSCFRLFLLLCLASRAALAQPLPDRAPVAGLVVGSDGKPLTGAIISLRRQESTGSFTFWGATTASNARGAWRFSHAEAGRYYLGAEAPGFAPISNQDLTWRAGDAPLRLQLNRLVSLRLQIAAPDGTALSRAPLWVRLRGDGDGGQATRRAVTDETGQVELGDLMPANYALWLTAPRGFAVHNGIALRQNQSQALTLQPGGTLLLRASQNGATDGGARALGGAVLTLVPQNIEAAAKTLGRSVDYNENLAFLAAGGEALALVSRDGDGQIEVSNLPPGVYLARLRLPGYALPLPQTVQVTAAQTTEMTVNFTPNAAADTPKKVALTLQLRPKAAGGGQTLGAREWAVRVLPIDQNGALAPESPDENAFLAGGNSARRALSDARGQITLFPLTVGRYRVFVGPRATPGDESQPEAASLDISVPAGGAAATLAVPVSP